MEFLRGLFTEHAHLLRIFAAGSLIFFVLTPVAVPAVIVIMPPDIMARSKDLPQTGPPLRRILFLIWRLVKNLTGAGFMVLGIVLLFLPGQGLLTLFVGVLLTDLPGKQRLLIRLLGSKKVRPAVDRLRRRFNREPLIHGDAGSRTD